MAKELKRLHIGLDRYDMSGVVNAPESAFEYLSELKAKAQYGNSYIQYDSEQPFWVGIAGSKSYLFYIFNEEFNFCMGAKGGIRQIDVFVSALSCVKYTREEIETKIYRFFEYLQIQVVSLSVYRIDVCHDVNRNVAYWKRFPHQSRHRKQVEIGRFYENDVFDFDGIYEYTRMDKDYLGDRYGSIASGTYQVAVYDKLKEILESSGKTYFIDRYKDNGYTHGEPVIRIEFRVMSDLIKKYVPDRNMHDVLDQIFSIVHNLSANHFLHVKRVNAQHKNRAELTPLWSFIQKGFEKHIDSPCQLIKVEKYHSLKYRQEENAKVILHNLIRDIAYSELQNKVPTHEKFEYIRQNYPSLQKEKMIEMISEKKLIISKKYKS